MKINYNQKNKEDKNTFEKVCNVIYLGMGLGLFSYTGYAFYQGNIKPNFSNIKMKAKSIERIVEVENQNKLETNNYLINEKDFKEYLRK